MYHKTTPPDVNQHRVVKAVLGKARFFFCDQRTGLPSGQTIIIQDELKSCQCNSPSQIALEEFLEGDIYDSVQLAFKMSHISLEREKFHFWKYELIVKVRGKEASETFLLCWRAVYTKGVWMCTLTFNMLGNH